MKDKTHLDTKKPLTILTNGRGAPTNAREFTKMMYGTYILMSGTSK